MWPRTVFVDNQLEKFRLPAFSSFDFVLSNDGAQDHHLKV